MFPHRPYVGFVCQALTWLRYSEESGKRRAGAGGSLTDQDEAPVRLRAVTTFQAVPHRPRSHQLEEESRRVFQDALPAAWVYRRHDPDYGLDYTVDIFQEGRATGLSFHAQLKATDEPDLDRALQSVRFLIEVADFYRSVAEPVLVVRYHAPTKRLFARWFHARNAGYVLRIGAEPRPDTKSVGFRVDKEDEWAEETPEQLVAGVRAFRKFHSPDLPLPIRLAVQVVEERPHGRTAIEHAFGLRRVLAEAADVIAVEVGAARPEDAVLSLGRHSLLVRLGDVVSISADVEERSSPEELDLLYADIGLAVGLLLAMVGQPNLASSVALVTAPRGRLIGEPEFALLVGGAMYRARRVVEALDLADRLDQRGDEDAQTGAMALTMSALARGPYMTLAEQAAYEDLMRKRMTRRLERGDLRAAASETYNLGVHFRSLTRGREAFRAYRRASKLDPRYLQRAYFNQELAGVLFELGFPRLAANCYRSAIEIGAEGKVTALLADSLLWAGLYRDADDTLAHYLDGNPGPENAEWRLKKAVLPLIRGFGGDEQVRQVEEAAKLAHLQYADLDELRAALERALSLDACCAEAWFHYTLVSVAEREDLGAGAGAAVTAAVLHRTAVGAWTNALLAARQSDEWQGVVPDLLRMAYKFNGDQLVEALTTTPEDPDVPGPDQAILETLNEVIEESQRARRTEGFTLRFFGDGDDALEIDVFPDERP